MDTDLYNSSSPGEQHASPVDIPFSFNGNASMGALAEEKAKEIFEANSQRVEELMAQLTKGFDPRALGQEIRSALPMLADSLFPGTYNHLLVLLFGSYDTIQTLQLGIEDWLHSSYKYSGDVRHGSTDFIDESLFAREIDMLRTLLEPLRGGTPKPIYWLDARGVHEPGCVRKQLERSIEIIEMFKNYAFLALESDHDDRTIYSDPPARGDIRQWEARTSAVSIKHLRLEACKATLSWDYFKGTEIELTTFHKFYKEHISNNEPERARASGWLPPISPQTPRPSAENADEGDPANWPLKESNEILGLLLKAVLWLAIARGLPAVHLFHDVTSFFALRNPSMRANEDRIRFLVHVARFRAYVEGTQPIPSPIVPRIVSTFPNCNPDYFDDVWRSKYSMVSCLFDDNSLDPATKRTTSSFKLSMPPCRLRRKKSQSTTQNTPGQAGEASDETIQDENVKNNEQVPTHSNICYLRNKPLA